MLVLARRLEESVDLFDKNGNKICEVKIVNLNSKQVKIGFLATDDVLIFRKEISDDAIRRHEVETAKKRVELCGES